MNEQQEIVKTNRQEIQTADRKEVEKKDVSVLVVKNQTTNSYIISEKTTYDFYLLYLLCTENLTPLSTETQTHHFEKNAGINFYKNSSMQCLATPQLFINKNNGYIELYSIYDLTNDTDDLCLPKSPKFIMTAKNFMQFMVKITQIHQQQAKKFFLVIDSQGHAHATTDLTSLEKTPFFASLQKKLSRLFSRSAQ